MLMGGLQEKRKECGNTSPPRRPTFAPAGGGLYASDTYEALIENSRFENNMAVLGGGASVFSCPKVRLVGNAFAGNSARGAGGGQVDTPPSGPSSTWLGGIRCPLRILGGV
jgi:hypothetical protein